MQVVYLQTSTIQKLSMIYDHEASITQEIANSTNARQRNIQKPGLKYRAHETQSGTGVYD